MNEVEIMKNKRAKMVSLILFGMVILTGCNTNVHKVKMNYGDTYRIQSENEDLTLESDDNDIIDIVDNDTVIAKAPGKAKIEVMENGETVDTYTFEVSIVPIEEIVFATDNMEITDAENSKIKYTLLPENASDYGITWTSVDESVATVNEKGELEPKAVGKTIVIATTKNGVNARCSVEVTHINAWEQLEAEEKKFVETVLPQIRKFKNPESVQFIEVRSNPVGDTDIWYFTVSATNSYGAELIKSYGLFGGNFGGMLTEADKVTGKTEYRADLITQAVHEKLGY